MNNFHAQVYVLPDYQNEGIVWKWVVTIYQDDLTSYYINRFCSDLVFTSKDLALRDGKNLAKNFMLAKAQEEVVEVRLDAS